jgi:DNA-directed RNA polymerase specialized sigma24 family protein
MTTRECKNCRETKPLEKFPPHRHECYVCDGRRRRAHNPSPIKMCFDALDKTTQETIIESRKNGLSYRKISEQTGVNYGTLAYWFKHGKITPIAIAVH